MLFIIINILVYIVYIKSYKTIRNFKYQHEIKKEGKEFQRDIDVTYSPSIVSYLYNQKIEPEKDLVADLLNLFARKLINIDNSYEITLNETEYSRQQALGKLLKNDEYIIDTLVLKNSKFSYEKWINSIIETYRKLSFPNKISKKDVLKPLLKYIVIKTIIEIIIVIISFSVGNGNLGFLVIILTIPSSFVLYAISNIKTLNLNEFNDMHLSNYGINELKNWIRLGNFINDYTLLKERNMEEIILYEKYIPFAMVLNINKKYKEDIFKIFSENNIAKIWMDYEEYDTTNTSNILKKLISYEG